MSEIVQLEPSGSESQECILPLLSPVQNQDLPQLPVQAWYKLSTAYWGVGSAAAACTRCLGHGGVYSRKSYDPPDADGCTGWSQWYLWALITMKASTSTLGACLPFQLQASLEDCLYYSVNKGLITKKWQSHNVSYWQPHTTSPVASDPGPATRWLIWNACVAPVTPGHWETSVEASPVMPSFQWYPSPISPAQGFFLVQLQTGIWPLWLQRENLN